MISGVFRIGCWDTLRLLNLVTSFVGANNYAFLARNAWRISRSAPADYGMRPTRRSRVCICDAVAWLADNCLSGLCGE